MPNGAWDEIITSRPQILPLPVPVPDLKDGDPVKYRAYDAIKDSLADPRHLPSFKPRTTPTAESLAIDKELANKVPNHLADRNKCPKLWVLGNGVTGLRMLTNVSSLNSNADDLAQWSWR
jgi:hypothetical protein